MLLSEVRGQVLRGGEVSEQIEPIVFGDVELDYECVFCTRYGSRATCKCGGKGFFLTDDGEALLAFVERHFRLKSVVSDVRSAVEAVD